MKGQQSLNQLLSGVMILIVVGVFIVVGVSLNDNLSDSHLISTTVTNETVALTNGTAATLSKNYATGITQVANTTYNIQVSGNVTYTGSKDGSAITVTHLTTTGTDIVTGDYNVSYTYGNPDNVHQVSTNTSLGLLEVGENMELLGLIIIMGAIILILMAAFGGFIGKGGI